MVSPEVTTSRNGEVKHGATYHCKNCSRIVAQQENVMDHVPGEGESSFSWHKRKSGNPFYKYDEERSSLFVEPLRWMMAVEEGALEGKAFLHLLRCPARLLQLVGYPVQLRKLDHSCLSNYTKVVSISAQFDVPQAKE